MLSKSLRAVTLEEISKNTIDFRAAEWARNIVKNEEAGRFGNKDGSVGITRFFGKLKNIPAVLIASGPSLDKNISQIKYAKNKSCIICVDSALRAVIEQNVEPDIVITADSKRRVKKYFEGIDTKNLVLICDVFTHPEVLDEWKGKIFFYMVYPNERNPLTQAIDKEFTGHIGALGSGGCVTSVALCFAHGALECDPILLLGMDCAFYDPKQHHASGVKDTESFGEIYEILEDVYGDPCLTNPVLRSYMYWMSDIVRPPGPHENRTAYMSGTFVNCTEGGILKEGWLIQRFEDARKRYLKNKVNIRKLLLGEEK